MNIRKKLKNKFILSTILVFVFSFLVFNISSAQEPKEPVDLREFKNMVVEVSADNTDTVNKMQIFWHDLKDTIDLALTFNKTKKIEKELKYAEKRIRWANTLSTFDSQDKKDLAFKLSAKADEYINKIVDRSANIFKAVDKRERNILENILIHQDNKAKVWENLESNIAVENSEDFMRIREQVESKQQNFMETVASNSDLSDDLRARFKNQAQETRQRRENRKNFIERNRQQLDNLNTSNNSDLKEFLEKRRQDMMHFNEEFQKEFEDISNENKQNINNETEEKAQNYLQNESSVDDIDNNSDNSIGTNSINIPEIDLKSPEYQEFLRMLDSSQPASDTVETVE